MKLSFVIPAYNEEHYIEDCLTSILAQTKGSPYDVEIIVTNNASTDRTADVVRRYPEVKLVEEKQKGIVYARRAGYLAATGDLIANVDSDSRLTPGWIKKVMDAFAKDEKLVAISGPFIYYDAPRKVRFFTRFYYYLGYIFYLLNRFVLRVGSMLQGGNFVVRRSALEKIGGYNTTVSFYGEDTDMARRLNKAGRVRFTFTLPMYSSGRRLAKEGGLVIALRYTMNYFWTTFFGHPYTTSYTDIRPTGANAAAYAPQDRSKEWAIGAGAVIILLVLAAAVVYILYSLYRVVI